MVFSAYAAVRFLIRHAPKPPRARSSVIIPNGPATGAGAFPEHSDKVEHWVSREHLVEPFCTPQAAPHTPSSLSDLSISSLVK